jgi:hypothetical protein
MARDRKTWTLPSSHDIHDTGETLHELRHIAPSLAGKLLLALRITSKNNRHDNHTEGTTMRNPDLFGKIILAGAIVCLAATLGACDALQTLAPAVASARNFAYAYKPLPDGTSIREAREWMVARRDGPRPGSPREDALYRHAVDMLSTDADWYSGNKPNNTRHFQLRSFPRGGLLVQGAVVIQARDFLDDHLQVTGHIGSTGALIDMRPFPELFRPVESGDFHFFVTEDGDGEVSTEYVNLGDPESYFNLEFTSFDETAGTASGTFEALVRTESGPHAGRIYAITDGEFLMDISN